MKYILTFLMVSLGLMSNAQVTRTIHQTFELSDENTGVALDIYDEFEVETWSSNNVMVVTTATLESGAQHLLDFCVEKQGRYNLEKSGEETSMTLTSTDKVRMKMRYKDQVVYEIVKMKIYIPENYQLAGKNKLVKKAEEEIVEKDQ